MTLQQNCLAEDSCARTSIVNFGGVESATGTLRESAARTSITSANSTGTGRGTLATQSLRSSTNINGMMKHVAIPRPSIVTRWARLLVLQHDLAR